MISSNATTVQTVMTLRRKRLPFPGRKLARHGALGSGVKCLLSVDESKGRYPVSAQQRPSLTSGQ
jgi:hypothetical protein